MAKRAAVERTESDGSERLLIELIEHFSARWAVDWLRVKFPSFDTGLAEPIPCDSNKNEKDYFATAEVLGYVTRLPQGKTDDTNRPILVAAVKMTRDMTERTSRLVQFNFAKKVLQNAVAHGAKGLAGLPSQGLFFFYDKGGHFRLSLVTGEVEKRKFKFNEAKRQSFYVERAAANNIVKRRLTPPIKSFEQLKEVFSVEQLTKEFYQKLFDWYTWAMAPKVNVNFPNDLNDDTDDRTYNNEAIIRLITRLMFTWFIRQRKLVPDELFDRAALDGILKKFDPDSMEQDTYYRAILQNLFFATFNNAQPKRKFIKIFQGKSDQRHVTTLYRYEKEFSDAASFVALLKRVPFLNCALFDCLDKVEERKYFDGFSGEKGCAAHVPNGLFFNSERGIINLFNLYEFTVNENDADDTDVALDPELLGKVFENLLGAYNPETRETARKATGSFYTPREIVDYMVEESLKNYLSSKVKAEGEQWKVKLDDLFDRTKAAEGAETMFSRAEREQLLDAIYDCKILDPACGSGAFPMGVLHCMVRLLTRLDPQALSIRERILQRYKVDKNEVIPGESAAERAERLAELQQYFEEGNKFPDYERKLYLIENCIYGVDIQPIATQISKLRFFISLLCDQLRRNYNPDEENFGLLSLPNLEAKFVCANTLIALPEVGALDASVGNLNELKEKLQENRHNIFRARSTKTKNKYKQADIEIRDEIRAAVRDSLSKPDEDVIARCRAEIAAAKKRREAVAEPDWVEEKVQVQADLFSAFESKTVRKDRNAPTRDKIDVEIVWAETQIKKELAKADKSNALAATRYADMVAGWDPYDQNASSPFFDPEWMFNLKDGFDVVIGNPPYVVVNKAEALSGYTTSTCYELYAYFFERGLSLVNGSGIVAYITGALYIKGIKFLPLRELLQDQLDILVLRREGDAVFEAVQMPTCVFIGRKPHQHQWSFDDLDARSRLCKRIMSMGEPISNFTCVQRGIEIGRDQILEKGDYDIVTGSLVGKYCVYRKMKISKRVSSVYGKDLDWFSGERILVREASSRLLAVYAAEKYYTNRSLYTIKILNKRYNVKSLVAFLNSMVFQFCYETKFKGDTELFPKIRIAQLKELSIPVLSKGNEESLEKLVDLILSQKKKDPSSDTSALEAQIDQLVYKLYGLTEEEIAIVEGRDKTAAAKDEAAATPSRRRTARPSIAADSPREEDDEELE